MGAALLDCCAGGRHSRSAVLAGPARQAWFVQTARSATDPGWDAQAQQTPGWRAAKHCCWRAAPVLSAGAQAQQTPAWCRVLFRMAWACLTTSCQGIRQREAGPLGPVRIP